MSHRLFRICSLLFTLVLALWSLLTVLTPPRGPVSAQLLALSTNFGPYAAKFSLALLIAPLLLGTLYWLVKSLDEPVKAVSLWLASLFYLFYCALVTVSFTSQVLFKFLFMKPHSALSSVLNWYFYQEASLAGALAQYGYLAFAAATLILFIPLCSVNNGLLKAINLFLVISALLQVAGAIARYYRAPFLDHLCLISLLMLLPVGMLSYRLAGLRGRK